MPKYVRKPRHFVGGPFNNEHVPLESAGTLEFTVGEFTGRYDNRGVWQPAPKPNNVMPPKGSHATRAQGATA